MMMLLLLHAHVCGYVNIDGDNSHFLGLGVGVYRGEHCVIDNGGRIAPDVD